jgi:hypothetical protein
MLLQLMAAKKKHFVELIPGESQIPLLGSIGEALQEGGEGTAKALNKAEGEVEGEAGALVKKATKAAQKPAEEALSATEKFMLKVAINGLLILAGLVLVVYGVMVAVRPRESAFSIPSGVPIPVPV